FFQAEDGIRDFHVTGVQTCALPISRLIEAGPVTRVGRLRMADGTTLLVSAVEPGGLSRVVRALADKHTVLVSGWARSDEGLEVRSEERRVGKEGRRRWSGVSIENNR